MSQMDLFAAAASELPAPWRDDEAMIPDDEPCPEMRWPVQGDPWATAGFDAYGAACLECGLPARAHWRYDLHGSPAGPGHLPYLEHRDTRWGDEERFGGDLLYRGACSCGWRAGRPRRHESTAFYAALFHAAPGWLDLPVYRGPRHPDAKKAQERKAAELLEMYGPEPAVVLVEFDIHGSSILCRGVVPGWPAEVCVHTAHHLDLLR